MSSISELASNCLAELADKGLVRSTMTIRNGYLCIGERRALMVPHEARAWSWRTTVNRSLLPVSVSAENRRHLLYAVLQDLIRPELLLHSNTSTDRPLGEFDNTLAPFDNVYRVPAERSSDRVILFPIHIAIPTVFDTYERRPTQKPQTDKGFRGKFIEFFSSDEAGFFDDHLLRVLRNLFAKTEGMTALDRALVEALGRRLRAARSEVAQNLLRNGDAEEERQQGGGDWWGAVYRELPTHGACRPLSEFAAQGQRLHDDVDAIAHTYGLSRIERVALVERLLAYHFALYLVRLSSVLYRELDWAYSVIWPDRSRTPWSGRELAIRYYERRTAVPREYHAVYQGLVEQLNEAYLLLPVLNNIELAVRAVAGTAEASPAQMSDGMWAEAKEELGSFDSAQLESLREVLVFLSRMACAHAGLEDGGGPIDQLANEPVEVLFDAIRLYYSAPNQRRYPKNHHQTVFETVAGDGSTSFIQRKPFRHVVLGDDLIYLLVLTLFEHRSPDERGDSTCVPRGARELRRQRLALREFEARLADDLLIPGSDAAREDLRSALTRLGLVDRLSDVGEGNFLRHPTGV